MTEHERLIEKICEGLAQNCGGDCTLPNKIYCQNCHILADYLLENGMLVPPCKVGDTVWVNNEYGTIKSKVSNITLIENNKFLVKLYYDARYCYDNHIETLGYVGYTEENFEFGKTVYSSKEEAEKALEAMNK